MDKRIQQEDCRATRLRTPKRAAAKATDEEIECPVGKERAAKILGICPATLDEWTARYGIRHIKYDMAGNTGNRGKVLYLPSDLLEFRERYRVNGRDVKGEVEAILAAPLDPAGTSNDSTRS